MIKSTIAPPGESHFTRTQKDSIAIGKSGIMESKLTPQFQNKHIFQQSEMVSANMVAPDMINNYNSKLLNEKQAKNISQSKQPPAQPPKKEVPAKKKKKEGCLIF